MPESRPDKTRNERQARRREREKKWLVENGWTSWETVHTALIRDQYRLIESRYEGRIEKA